MSSRYLNNDLQSTSITSAKLNYKRTTTWTKQGGPCPYNQPVLVLFALVDGTRIDGQKQTASGKKRRPLNSKQSVIFALSKFPKF